MEFVLVETERFQELVNLQIAYKSEIGEDCLTQSNINSLKNAIEQGLITFYGCICKDKLVACCSICLTYSTFNYDIAGVFEDFYILPAYRHKGLARRLVKYAYANSGASSLYVGCADCDVGMYNALGFDISLGNMLAYSG